MRFEHVPLPAVDALDARPVGGAWSVLTRQGLLGGPLLDLEGLAEPLALHAAPDGSHVAVVERRGRHGRVYRAADGALTMRLDRGDYNFEFSDFPCAFLIHEGCALLVHGTDWNRLDVSDPATGERLTERGPTAILDDGDHPPHYLDYFHAGLDLSPDGRWIAEDGWVWHPFGELRVWSMARWLGENVWKSEDGPSLQWLARRDWFWDGPRCWIDARRLAFWGEGDDESEMRDCVRLYDVEERREIARFPGPPKGWMTFDELLFVVSEEGTGAWTLEGKRVHFEPGWRPRRYSPARRTFLNWEDGGLTETRWFR